jgi:Cdc6-like AAA superfamily ATPase
MHVLLNQISLPRIYISRPLPDSSIYAPSFSMGSLHAKAGTTNKLVVIMGATGTGKSKLTINLTRRLSGEVVNSDKIQVYDNLDVVTTQTRSLKKNVWGC